MRFFPKKLKNGRGQFFILLLLTIVVILGIVGLSVDGGGLYFRWTGLSRALDAACVAVAKKAPTLTDSQILSTAQSVASFNLQQQGADIANFVFSGSVTRRPEFSELVKIRLNGTLNNLNSVLIKLIPGNESASVKADTKCPTCYDNPNIFSVPNPGLYQGGMACQKVCNDGSFKIPDTDTCCSYAHSFHAGDADSKCMCSYNASMEGLTGNCNPDAQPAAPVDPDNPGINGPVWIDRPDFDNLGNACAAKCASIGQVGYTSCNEDCRETTGTICCMCHCVPDEECLPCDSSDDIIRCPLECGAHCNNGTCEVSLGETCTNCPQDCGSCSPKCGDAVCMPGLENCLNCPLDCGTCLSCPNSEECNPFPGPCPGGKVQTANSCVLPGPAGTLAQGICCGPPWDPMCMSDAECTNPANPKCCMGACTPGPTCDEGCASGDVCQMAPCGSGYVQGTPATCDISPGMPGGTCCHPGPCTSDANCASTPGTPFCCIETGTCQADCNPFEPCMAPNSCQTFGSCMSPASGTCANQGEVCCSAGNPCSPPDVCQDICGMGPSTNPVNGYCTGGQNMHCCPQGPECTTPGYTCQASCGMGGTGMPPTNGHCTTGMMCCPPSGPACATPNVCQDLCGMGPAETPVNGYCSTSGMQCCPPPGPPCTTPGYVCQASCGMGGGGTSPVNGSCTTGMMCCPPSGSPCNSPNLCQTTCGSGPQASPENGYCPLGMMCCAPSGPPCTTPGYVCSASCGMAGGTPPSGGYCTTGMMCCPPTGSPCNSPNICQSSCGMGPGASPENGYCPMNLVCCAPSGPPCTTPGYVCAASCGMPGSSPSGGYCTTGMQCCPPAGNPCGSPNVCQTSCGPGPAASPENGYCPTWMQCCPPTTNPVCGNGILENGEACDGAMSIPPSCPAGQTGTVVCSACQWNYSGCTTQQLTCSAMGGICCSTPGYCSTPMAGTGCSSGTCCSPAGCAMPISCNNNGICDLGETSQNCADCSSCAGSGGVCCVTPNTCAAMMQGSGCGVSPCCAPGFCNMPMGCNFNNICEAGMGETMANCSDCQTCMGMGGSCCAAPMTCSSPLSGTGCAGGSCCMAGGCQMPVMCGNMICEAGENCSSCPMDCHCNANENCSAGHCIANTGP